MSGPVKPFALKDAPALIERLLPVQKLSAEAYKEQMPILRWQNGRMIRLIQNLRRIAASSLFAEAHSSGAERRRNVAHGVSRGISGGSRKSPGGAKENLAQGALSCSSVAPNGAYVLFERCPTAHAVGYGLSPLRGFAKCRLSPGTRTPENGQSPVSGQRRDPQMRFTALAAKSIGGTHHGQSQRDCLATLGFATESLWDSSGSNPSHSMAQRLP